MKTNKIKKVLIALDYDPTAQKIAESGYMLAKSMEAEVVLLHVISDHLHYSTLEFATIMGHAGFADLGQFQADDTEFSRKESQIFLDKSRLHLGDNTIQTMVAEGDFAESIIEAAINLHADIIVMGSHSRKWLENIVMGSVTKKVLQHTSIPLFIIPTKKTVV